MRKRRLAKDLANMQSSLGRVRLDSVVASMER